MREKRRRERRRRDREIKQKNRKCKSGKVGQQDYQEKESKYIDVKERKEFGTHTHTQYWIKRYRYDVETLFLTK